MSGPTLSTSEMPGRPVSFRVRKEGWNYYEVPDWDIEVAVRQVLLLAVEVDVSRIVQPDGTHPPTGTMAVNATPLVVVSSKTRRPQTPPQPPPTMEEFDRKGVFLAYRAVEEFENEYLLLGYPERYFTTRAVVTAMRLLPGRYDPAGYPAVHVQHALAIGLARPLDLRAKTEGA